MIRRTSVPSRVRRNDYGRLVARATESFNRFIVIRDGCCQKCGVTINLGCGHIVTAKRHATRWASDNAVALCHGCHRYFTDNRNAWDAWVINRIGFEAYEHLKIRSLRAVPSWEVKEMASDAVRLYGAGV